MDLEVVKIINPNTCEMLLLWLDRTVRRELKEDKSSYSLRRSVVWLGVEPEFSHPYMEKPGMKISQGIWQRMESLIEWRFDYWLITYSRESGDGIGPHRDSGFAEDEASGLSLGADCVFDIWGKGTREADQTDSIIMKQGQVIRFNCKKPHAAVAYGERWGMNFWRRKAHPSLF